METIKAGNGIINPRYYQIPQDKIEAKQAMEPIAIAAGMGPILGFNVVDTTGTYVKITGMNNPNILMSEVRRLQILNESKTVDISINGVEGKVVNAHITTSGLLSIDPVEIDTGILSSTVATQHAYIVLVSRLDYTSEIENNLENVVPPNNNNFTAYRITGWRHNGVDINSRTLLNYSYRDLMGTSGILASGGITLDSGKENLIGIYEFNVPETVKNDFPEFYPYQPPIVSTIPYYNIWPPRANFNLETASLLKHHQNRILWILENLSPEVDTPQMKDGAVTTPKIKDGAVTTPKIADNAVTTSKVATGAITTSKLGEKSVTTEKIANDSVTGEKIKNNSISEEKLATDSVTTLKIKNEAITGEKIANKSIEAKHLKNKIGKDEMVNGIVTDGFFLLEMSKKGLGVIKIHQMYAILTETAASSGIQWDLAGGLSTIFRFYPQDKDICSILQFDYPRETTNGKPKISTMGMFRAPARETLYLHLFIEVDGDTYLVLESVSTSTVTIQSGTSNSVTMVGYNGIKSIIKSGGRSYVVMQFMYDVNTLKDTRGSIKIDVLI